MPTYVPNNLLIFTAAYSGAIAGMAASYRTPTDPIPSDPVNTGVAKVAGAFAQSYDTLWGSASVDQLDVSATQELCSAAWWGRAPQANVPVNLIPATFNPLADALIAIVDAGEAYFASIGVAPPAISSEFAVVVFRQGGIASGNVFTSFASACSALAPGGTMVIDSSLAPSGIAHTGVGEFSINGVTFIPWRNAILFPDPTETFSVDRLEVDAGAQLLGSLRIIGYLGLILNAQAGTPSLVFDTANGNTDNLVVENAAIVMASSATGPGCVIPGPNGELGVTLYLTTLGATGAAQPIFHGADGATLSLDVFDFCTVDPSAVTGSAAVSFLYDHDSSCPFVVFPGLGATQTDVGRVDLASQCQPAFGATVARPVPPNVLPGQMMFDTSIAGGAGEGKPIWFVGISGGVPTGWVDATGTGA